MTVKLTYVELEKIVYDLKQEIIECRNIQRSLHQAEETARALLNATTDSAILIDIQGSILAINENAVKILAKSDADVMRKNLFEILPSALARYRKAMMAKVLDTGDPLHFEDDHDGTVFANTLYPVFGREGKIQSLAFFSRDITVQRQVEQALRESELKFRSISASAQDAFIMMNGQGQIAYWNPSAERVFGYSAAEAIGQDLHRLLAPERYYEAFQKSFKTFKRSGTGGRVGRTYEFVAVRRDKSEFPIELSLSALKLRGEWHSFGIVRDISKRKQAEEQLRQSETRYRELSITDDLTKLYNARHFYARLQFEIERANRYLRPLALFLLDIDDFKKFNDNYGHLTGNKVLVKTGDVIRNSLRDTDSGYRYGGEEFAVILPETDGPGAIQVAERLRVELESTPIAINPGTSRSITASIGISQLQTEENLSEFIKRADDNLYVAKAKGKNQVIFI